MKPLRNLEFFFFKEWPTVALQRGFYRLKSAQHWGAYAPLAQQPSSISPVHANKPFCDTPCCSPGSHFEDEKQQILASALNHRTHFTSQAKGRCPSIPSHLLPSEYILAIQGVKLAGLSMRGQDHTQDWSHFKILCFDWEAMAQIFVSIPVLENHPLMSALPFVYFWTLPFNPIYF